MQLLTFSKLFFFLVVFFLVGPTAEIGHRIMMWKKSNNWEDCGPIGHFEKMRCEPINRQINALIRRRLALGGTKKAANSVSAAWGVSQRPFCFAAINGLCCDVDEHGCSHVDFDHVIDNIITRIIRLVKFSLLPFEQVRFALVLTRSCATPRVFVR